MTYVVVCQGCGCRNRLARRLYTPEQLWLVCAGCESQLSVQVTWAMLLAPEKASVAA